jgi:hypothetical protein
MPLEGLAKAKSLISSRTRAIYNFDRFVLDYIRDYTKWPYNIAVLYKWVNGKVDASIEYMDGDAMNKSTCYFTL